MEKFEAETMNILDVLQRRGRIRMLTRAYELDKESFQWGDFIDLHYNDLTYRTAMREFIELKLMKTERPEERVHFAYNKEKFRLTDFGCLIASLVSEKVRDLDTLVKRKTEVLNIA